MSTTTEFLVRKAVREDGEGILQCLAEAFAPYQDDYTPEAFADTVLTSQALERRIAEMCLFVAVAAEQIVGTIGCSVNGGEGHLRGMAVRPKWQGSGVASALLLAAEQEMRKQGCEHMTLDTTKPLERAVHFYKKHGFSPSGRVIDFFGMPLFEFSKSLGRGAGSG
jgi:GNAT superfamily N-acetyltransferase